MIPADYLKLLGREGKTDNREIIIDYLLGRGGGVALSEFQQKLLERWQEADRLMRKRDYTTNEIVHFLKEKFKKDVATARRDIADAQYVFGSTAELDKNYLLANHIDHIQSAIVIAQRMGKDKLVESMMNAKLKAILALPDNRKINTQPAAIIFHIDTRAALALVGQKIEDVDPESLMKKIASMRGVTIEDIESEDI